MLSIHLLYMIIVTAPDGPPLSFTVTADGTTLRLNWQPPAGDQTILSYTVSCSVAGVMRVYVQLKPILTFTLNHLEPSTEYSCTVYASSSGGAGPTTEAVVTATESNVIYLYLVQ